jgi:chorismate-pyruvate lyase
MDQVINPRPREEQAVNPLEPFYRAAGAAVPSYQLVDGALVPEPFRRLLVHERDMTSTLEAFLGQALSLEVLETRVEGDCLSREVVLTGERDGVPAEFGAIRIHLDRLPEPEARSRVVEGQRPLGRILRDLAIEHRCRPVSFFHVDTDDVMRSALALRGDGPLYGRHNLLFGAGEALMAEVTEILPPFTDRDGGNE